MTIHRRRLATGLAGCLLVAGAWTVPATVAAAGAPALHAGARPPAGPVFAPGTWRGRAVGTGAISADGGSATISQPFLVDFEFVVAGDGSVTNGLWSWTGAVTATTEAAGTSVFSFEGEGELGGTQTHLVLTGVIHVAGSVTVQGQTLTVDSDEPANAEFFPGWASCTVVTGDLALPGRASQTAAGVATSVRAPYTARLVAPADADTSLEQAFSDLVLEAETLAGIAHPIAAQVVDLVERVESWQHNLFRAGSCGGATPNLAPGTQPHTYLVQLLGAIVIAALGDPTGYSADQVQMIANAAVRIGIVGVAAPDAELSTEVLAVIDAALRTKLGEAITKGDETSCTIIAVTAYGLGLTALAGEALACA